MSKTIMTDFHSDFKIILKNLEGKLTDDLREFNLGFKAGILRAVNLYDKNNWKILVRMERASIKKRLKQFDKADSRHTNNSVKNSG